MEYRNTKTGATFSSPFAISGGNWVKVTSVKEEPKEVIQETNETEEEKNQTAENQNPVEHDTPENTISTDSEEITKAQIMQELDAFGVEYNPRDKKQVLYDLMMSHGK